MSHIPSSALSTAVDTFLASLFGTRNFHRWQKIKKELNMCGEPEFVTFLLDATEEKIKLSAKCNGSSSLSTPDALRQQVVILDGDTDYVIDETKPLDRGNQLGHAMNHIETREESAVADIVHVNGTKSAGEFDSNNLVLDDCDDDDDDDDDYLERGEDGIMFDSDDGDDFDCGEHDPDKDPTSLTSPGKENVTDDALVSGEEAENAFAYSKSMGLISVGNSKKEPKCQYCGKKYSTWTNARRHEANVHLGIRRYKCQHCERAFSEKHKLNRHVQCVHLKLREFQCQYCGKEFSQFYSLTYHSKVCNGQYKCTHCDMPFDSGEDLYDHLDQQHSSEHGPVNDTIL